MLSFVVEQAGLCLKTCLQSNSVSDKVGHKPACVATGPLAFELVNKTDTILTVTKKVLISLCQNFISKLHFCFPDMTNYSVLCHFWVTK